MTMIQSALYFPELGKHFRYPSYKNMTHRKFFNSTWSCTTPQKTHFLKVFNTPDCDFELVPNLKKLCPRTFCAILNDLCVVWWRRLLLRIPYILKKYQGTCLGVLLRLENFFVSEMTKRYFCKKGIFYEDFLLISNFLIKNNKKHEKSLSPCV